MQVQEQVTGEQISYMTFNCARQLMHPVGFEIIWFCHVYSLDVR